MTGIASLEYMMMLMSTASPVLMNEAGTVFAQIPEDEDACRFLRNPKAAKSS